MGNAEKHGGDDDEIKSNDSDAWIDREPVNPSHAKRKELLNDPFFQVEDDDKAGEMETIEEKRLKMAN